MQNLPQIIKGITISACLYAWYIPVTFFKSPNTITIQEELDSPVIVQWADLSIDETTPEQVSTEIVTTDTIESTVVKPVKKTPTDIALHTKNKAESIEPEHTNPSANQSTNMNISAPIEPTIPITKRTKTDRSTKNAKPQKKQCQITNPNIAEIAPGFFTMPKALFKHYATHWIEANALARLVWKDNADGEHYGITIKQIACTSPLKFTGLQRGDVVLTVNEHTIQSDRDILKLYTKALLWKEIDVIILRKGKPMKLHYSLV